MSENKFFFKKLIPHKIPLRKLLRDGRLFEKVPADWHIIVADIEESTEAIANGLHNEVNLAATGSIVSVLNQLKKYKSKIKVPYFFGGDGATFIVPPSTQKDLMNVLNKQRLHVKKNLKLDLRVGSIPVKDVYRKGHRLRIAKIRLNDYLITPVVLGTALKYAEKVIKNTYEEDPKELITRKKLDLTGMECRWDEIEPPKTKQKVVCLLINCDDDKLQRKIYEEVITKLDRIFGDLHERQPISTIKLQLDTTIAKIRKEMYARIGKYNVIYLFKNWLVTGFGKYYFKYFEEGKSYLFKVSQLSDTLMIDGSINTVISGDQNQIDRLIAYLDEMEANKKN
ncbi:DUF3095 family protein [Gillisia marina]|uniref:DUF3095 family protein n=1 Tax=Gillisia marina TaxID=1167637 RepID=UPI001ED8C103|nr:DUF3095 family protein [Gillisia marina]